MGTCILDSSRTDFCEHGDDNYGPVENLEFIGELGEYHLLKKTSV